MKRFSIFTKLIYSFALLAVITAACVFFRPISANAASYYRFDGITALAVADTKITVADKNGVTVVSTEGNALCSVPLPGVTDVEVHNEATYVLIDGTVYTVDVKAGTTQLFIDATDIEAKFIEKIEAGLVVAGESTVRIHDFESGALNQTFPVSEQISGLEGDGNDLYYSVRGYRSSLYKSGDVQPTFESIDFYSSPVISNGSWYAITRSGDVATLSSIGSDKITDNRFVVALQKLSDGLCYATDRGEIFTYRNGTETLIAASDSGEHGFYSAPVYAAARFSRAYVCDYYNDRVAVISDKTEYLSFPRPSATAIDNAANVFIAHSVGKITRLSADGSSDVIFDGTGKITALATDTANTLYAVISSKLYRIENGEKIEMQGDVTSLSVSFGTEKLIFSTANNVHFIDGSLAFSAPDFVSSVAMDAGNNFYYISGNSLYKRDGAGAVTTVLDTLSGKNCFVTISKAKTSLTSYGDVIVADGGACKLTVIPSADAGIVTPTETPSVTPYDTESIIHTLLYDSALYASPHEADVKTVLKAGTTVIIAKAELEGNAGLSYCCYEDKVSKQLIFGYLFKSNVGSALEYKTPPAESGILYAGNANLYSLPSAYSDKVVASLPKDTALTLLPFADYQTESGRWYRASDPNGNVGYVPANTVSVRGFIPDGIRPQYNAEIVANGDSVVAAVYENVNGEMVKINGEFLTVGTKIEVVGSFDTSEEYTKIKYFNEDLGTLTCYVLTDYVDYNSFSIVQVIAILIVVVTVVLLGVLLLRIYSKKRKL